MDRDPLTDSHFLVLGCGSIGRRHIRNLRHLGAKRITGFDPRPERVQTLVREDGINGVSSLEAAWDSSPDVVFITASTSAHLALASEAVQRGCHLFIEKPLAHRFEGVAALVEQVEQRSLRTLVGCNMRFAPGLRTVRTLLQGSRIGRVVAARIEVGQYLPDWHPWEDYREGYSALEESGGGIILDAIHEIDYARWLFGEVASVTCFADRLSHLEIETEDTAAMLLRFRSGVIGEIHMDYVQRDPSRSCHIIGDLGTIRWDFKSGEVRLYTQESGTWTSYRRDVHWEASVMYVDELRHFLDVLAGRTQSEQDVREAAEVLRVALAAKQASKEERVVNL